MAKEKKDSSRIFADMKGRIGSAEELSKVATERALASRADLANYIKSNFSSLVEQLQLDTYNLYLEAERRVGGEAIKAAARRRAGNTEDVEQVFACLEELFPDFDRFFLSLTQSRRPRAGGAFQFIVADLLARLGFHVEAQPILEDSKPDFILPSRLWYKHDPSDCIILTLKRTLRERWRQVPTEGSTGTTFFLGTIDENVAKGELDKMRNLNVRLVVPKRIKLRVYGDHPAVISFEDFIEDYLEPAMLRWRKRGAFLQGS